MRDYLCIGPVPADEPRAQLGQPDYARRAKAECRRYIDKLRECFGWEPAGAQLAIKGFDHDFGRYYEVVCWYDDDCEEAMEYAFRCENDAPATWDAEPSERVCGSVQAARQSFTEKGTERS